METVSIREAQRNLSAFLRRVENGEKIAIRRRNRVVARLIPETDEDPFKRKVDWGSAFEEVEAYWADKPFIGKSMAEIVSEGRGDR
jgi:prevent-host-death family protein